ncbi:MAG: hypothetical protein GX325_01425 [Peptococcaceae bacterium]|nr:hypothetical protein [Peptococcaceae bacterium]
MLTNQKIKEEWLAALSDLVGQVKEWSRPRQDTSSCSCCSCGSCCGSVDEIMESAVELEEGHIGCYNAPVLYLKTKNTVIELKPIGRFAIGAIGRVDMSNNICRYSLLYSSKKGWLCLENRQALSKSLFLELVAALDERQRDADFH